MAKKTQILPNKYALYEASVQAAEDDAEILRELYSKIRKKQARRFREDFCGTFQVAAEWVKKSPKNKALALDIDPAPLAYGREHHLSKLDASQQKRLRVMQKNVMTVTSPKSDLIAASNFSYWIFKERKAMIRYFKAVRQSLQAKGLFFLDIVGGTEMIEEHKDTNRFKVGKQSFTYYWELERFNPVTHEGFFSISYKMKGGKKQKQVFTYDWRVWSIPEIRECLHEAGFEKTWIFWERDDEDGQGTGEFYLTEKEENCPVWIAYVVGSPRA